MATVLAVCLGLVGPLLSARSGGAPGAALAAPLADDADLQQQAERLYNQQLSEERQALINQGIPSQAVAVIIAERSRAMNVAITAALKDAKTPEEVVSKARQDPFYAGNPAVKDGKTWADNNPDLAAIMHPPIAPSGGSSSPSGQGSGGSTPGGNEPTVVNYSEYKTEEECVLALQAKLGNFEAAIKACSALFVVKKPDPPAPPTAPSSDTPPAGGSEGSTGVKPTDTITNIDAYCGILKTLLEGESPTERDRIILQAVKGDVALAQRVKIGCGLPSGTTTASNATSCPTNPAGYVRPERSLLDPEGWTLWSFATPRPSETSIFDELSLAGSGTFASLANAPTSDGNMGGNMGNGNKPEKKKSGGHDGGDDDDDDKHNKKNKKDDSDNDNDDEDEDEKPGPSTLVVVSNPPPTSGC